MSDNKITATLKSGATVTGTPAQIAELLKTVDGTDTSAGLYYSESKGAFLPIAEMYPRHIKNAMLKLYRQWTENLSHLDGTKLIKEIQAGTTDPTMISLITAYIQAIKDGKVTP